MASLPHVYGPLGTLGVRTPWLTSTTPENGCFPELGVCVSDTQRVLPVLCDQTLSAVYRQEGVWGFYHGLLPSIISHCGLSCLGLEEEANTGHVAL
jgi:hypothetical protein